MILISSNATNPSRIFEILKQYYSYELLSYFRILFFIISWAKRHVKIKFVLIQLKIKRHWNSFYRNWFNLGKNLWSTIRLQFRYKTYINACEGGNINSFCRRFTKEFFLNSYRTLRKTPHQDSVNGWLYNQHFFSLSLTENQISIQRNLWRT